MKFDNQSGTPNPAESKVISLSHINLRGNMLEVHVVNSVRRSVMFIA
jgi:hypothetical protein